MLYSVLSTQCCLQKQAMPEELAEFWVDKAIEEIDVLDKLTMTVSKFQEYIDEKVNDDQKAAPPTIEGFISCLLRFAPEDMLFSVMTLGAVSALSLRLADSQILAWSLVMETMKNDGKVVTLRNLRHGFGPSNCITQSGLSQFWKDQKITRDPVTRSDNFLDLAKAWTLEGVRDFNNGLR